MTGLLIAALLLGGAGCLLGSRARAAAEDIIRAVETIAAGGLPGPVRGRSGLADRARRALSSVSERMAGLEARAAAEADNLRAILGSMCEGVFLLDPARRVRLANDSALALFSIESPPLGRHLVEVLRNPAIETLVERCLASGAPQAADVSHEVRSGAGWAKRHMHVTAAPVRGARGGPGAVVVVHDLTEIRRLEAVRREFITNVSHEIRTPLAIITGYLETLLDGAADDPALARPFLETMRRHGNRLNLLIEDLLTISRFESGRERLHTAPASLRDIITSVVRQLDPRIRSAGARVTVDIPADLPLIEADALRLEQLFFNLLDNALKYGTGPSPAVWFTARLNGEEVVVHVRDNGPGIPIHDQPHVFERFYRIHKDRSRDAGGTGLGLSIVKHIALVHGGAVSLSSVPGEGCTFTVRLPLRAPKNQTASPGAPPPPAPDQSPPQGAPPAPA